MNIDYGASVHSTTARVEWEGKAQRTLSTLGHITRANGEGGLTYADADRDHVAFVFTRTDRAQAQNTWDLYSYDRKTHTMTRVGSNPGFDGRPMLGGWVRPMVTPGHLYWIQASRDSTGRYSQTGFGSELMSYDFANGTTSVLYRGLVTSIMPYGGRLLFTADPPGGPPKGVPAQRAQQVMAIRQSSGALVPAPAGITAGADMAGSMSTNGTMIVWVSSLTGALRGWTSAQGRSINLTPGRQAHWPGSSLNTISDPQMVGHIVVWNNSGTLALDTRSHSVARLTRNVGGASTAGSKLAMWEYTNHPPASPSEKMQFSEQVIDLARLPELPTCGSSAPKP